MMIKTDANPYLILTIILSYYLFSQLFQQYVLRISSISNPISEEEAFLFSQHWLNYARLWMILISMFLMAIAWVIIYFHFRRLSHYWSLSALIFLLLFCLFEIFYRSIELFMVVPAWGPDIIQAQGDHREKLLGHYAMWDSFVTAIYFPLLFSQLLGSLIFAYLANEANSRLFKIAMILNGTRLVLRLSDYVGLPELNIFSGFWYFPPVAIIFIMMILWSYKEFRKSVHQNKIYIRAKK
jgi:membrane protein YdbS with pleckstrin-like domain